MSRAEPSPEEATLPQLEAARTVLETEAEIVNDEAMMWQSKAADSDADGGAVRVARIKVAEKSERLRSIEDEIDAIDVAMAEGGAAH